MARYILVPQRQGKTQRITLPMEMLRAKGWLKTECYLMIDEEEHEITLRQYLYDLIEDPAEPEALGSSWDKLIGELSDD